MNLIQLAKPYQSDYGYLLHDVEVFKKRTLEPVCLGIKTNRHSIVLELEPIIVPMMTAAIRIRCDSGQVLTIRNTLIVIISGDYPTEEELKAPIQTADLQAVFDNLKSNNSYLYDQEILETFLLP